MSDHVITLIYSMPYRGKQLVCVYNVCVLCLTIDWNLISLVYNITVMRAH